MANLSGNVERPRTRAFTTNLKRKERVPDSTDSQDDHRRPRKMSFDCLDAHSSIARELAGSDCSTPEMKTRELRSEPPPAKRPYQGGSMSPASSQSSPRLRLSRSDWEPEALLSDPDTLPMKPDGSGSRLRPPLTPDWYLLFNIDPRADSGFIWEFFWRLSEAASSAIETITVHKQPLSQKQREELDIWVLDTPADQLHYCNELLSQAFHASGCLLWQRRRYDSVYRLVRAENEEFAYAFWNSMGCKAYFHTIYERIEVSIVGEARAHREALKERPINKHRISYPDVDDDSEGDKDFAYRQKVDRSKTVPGRA